MPDPQVPLTIQDIEDERGRVLNALDDIIRTAKDEGRLALTDAERAEHDELDNRVADLDAQLVVARSQVADDARFAAAEARRSVNVNRISVAPASASRSLDELLYASPEAVRASGGTAANPVDQVIVRSADGGFVPAPRIDELIPEHRSVVRSFQQTVEDMAFFGLMLDRSARSSADGFEVARSHPAMKGRWQQVLRAMDVDTSAEGTEWVPTGIGSSFHEKVRAMGKVAPLFTRINLPTNPWKWPLEGADATAYRVGEPTGDTESKMTASTPGTGAATFDAEIFGARALFSRSLDADSIIAIMPYQQMKLAKAHSIAEEQAILDGDTDGTHQDSDVGASTTDARTAWDGLRKKALAQTVVTATTASVANLLAIRAGMGKWGVNPSDLVYIVGVSNYSDLIADTNLLTVDKYGSNATILNGEVAKVAGVPVVVSEHVRENLNASGVYDGITQTKTFILCVNRNEWAIGQRMALDIEVDDSIYRETFQRVMVSFQRQDFQHIGSAAADDNTAIAYNVTP